MRNEIIMSQITLVQHLPNLNDFEDEEMNQDFSQTLLLPETEPNETKPKDDSQDDFSQFGVKFENAVPIYDSHLKISNFTQNIWLQNDESSSSGYFSIISPIIIIMYKREFIYLSIVFGKLASNWPKADNRRIYIFYFFLENELQIS